MRFKTIFQASVIACLAIASASAADLKPRPAPPAPAPIVEDLFQPFQIRARVTVLLPDGGSTQIYDRYGKILPLVGLSAGPGSIIAGSGLHVSTQPIPELDISYYFNKNFAIEVICCVTRHTVTGTGSLAGLYLGSTWAFPPSIMFQYHFTELGAFQPYVGVGPNFTYYFGTTAGFSPAPFYSSSGAPVGTNSVGQFNISSSWGVVAQIGFDYMFNEHWGVNIDVKRFLMQPQAYAQVYNSATNAIIPVRVAQVNIDPWLISAGLTYRFGGASATPVLAKY